MKDRTTGELLFRWVCLVLVYSVSVDSLNWTVQPANPTELIKGQDVSLTWNFSLTADEQADRQSYYSIIWRKFNPSSASYDTIGSRIFLKVIGSVQYAEPQAPHIVVDRAEANDSAALQINNVQSADEARYKIDYTLTVSGPPVASQEFNLTVLVPPDIANVSSDAVVCEGSMVTLSCNATGKPTPSITWTRVFDNGTDSAPLLPVMDGKYVINNITRSSNGTYRCTADNRVGGPVNRTVRLTVRYSASDVRIVNSSNTVNEGGSFNITCEASGDPKPNVHWITNYGQRINGNIVNFANINRSDSGQYRCEAENDCGSDSRVQSIEVYYAPSVDPYVKKIDVTKGNPASYVCPADGNPPPNVTWYKGNGISSNLHSSGSELKIENLQSNESYTCVANNSLGTASGSVNFVVVSSTTTNSTTTCTSEEAEGTLEPTVTIQDITPDIFAADKDKFCENVTNALEQVGACNCFIKSTSPGSVIVDLLLWFNQSVSVANVISILKTAARERKFGNLNVDPESIQEITSPPPTSNTGSPKVSPCLDSLFKDADCKLKVIILVIFIVCGVLLFACVVGGAIYYWVHKRKKCRKDPRIHNSDDHEALHGNQSGADENAYSQANGGYADLGPPSANGTDAAEQQQQVQGAPPTKFTKKQKREEEKRKKEEEKKMKEEEKRKKEEEKKKKEVVEDAYAQVDTSKKSKKKAKPGEMLYADLGEFKPREMPAVSVSPYPLPPIKRSPAYEETQYADITQYLKGNATLPDTNNSPGTEMTFANVDGGKENPKDTANEGRNEEKPNETRM